MKRFRAVPRGFKRRFGYARLVCLVLLFGFAALRVLDPPPIEELRLRIFDALKSHIVSATCTYSRTCAPFGYSKCPSRMPPVRRSKVMTSSCVGMSSMFPNSRLGHSTPKVSCAE